MYYSKQRQLNEVIPDNSKQGLIDTIAVSQNASIDDINLRVHIKHPYTGDLNIKLTAPDGKSTTLLKKSNRKGKNLDKTFTANELGALLGKKAKGNWKLQVIDSNARDKGKLVSWELNLKLNNANTTELFVPNDPKKTLKSAHYCHEEGKISSLKASINIAHERAGDLVVHLCSPSGKKVKLFSDKNSTKKNLKKSFPAAALKAFNGEKAKGNWTLEVKDLKKDNYGMLRNWSLDIITEN